MTTTEFKINDQVISYEVTEDSYYIYLGDNLTRPWISQEPPYVYGPGATIEEKCLNHIRTLATPPTPEPCEELSVETQRIDSNYEILQAAVLDMYAQVEALNSSNTE